LSKEVKIGYPGRIEGMKKGEKLTKGEREENWLLIWWREGGRKRKKKKKKIYFSASV
jgi:hypothetical protein